MAKPDNLTPAAAGLVGLGAPPEQYPHLSEMVAAVQDMQDNCFALPPWIFRWYKAKARWERAFVAHARQWTEEGLPPIESMRKRRRWLRRRGVILNEGEWELNEGEWENYP